MRNTDPVKRTLQGATACLWREDPEEIERLYDASIFGLYDVASNAPGHHGMRAERMRELRSPLPMRQRKGSTIAEIATSASIERATLVALLKHHGYVKLFPYGREQSRLLLTDASFKAGIGHNVQPGEKRSVRLDGANRVAPFPVIYPECVPSLLWSLDWAGVQAKFIAVASKRERVALGVSEYGYLPDTALANLCGCTVNGIEKARSRRKPFQGVA
jgi:hypothetical protein